MSLREIEALPGHLNAAVRGVKYAPLDLLLEKYAHNEEKRRFLKKYEQYFKAITTETSYTESLMNVSGGSSEYLKKHRMWFPYLQLDMLNLPSPEDIKDEDTQQGVANPNLHKQNSDDVITNTTTTTKQKLRELAESLETNFYNYLHIPYVFGQEPVPPLINHVSNAVGNDIYICGGLKLMTQDEQNETVDYITNHGLIPMENVQVNMPYNLPVPLNAEILKSPFMKPNTDVYVYSANSQTINRLGKLDNFKLDKPNTPKLDSDTLPPLLAASSCVISKRHIFYYGGFQINTTITRRDTSTVIDKEVVMNSRAWILDTSTMRFKAIKLDVHPTLTTKFPNEIPRFGHMCVLVTLEEVNEGQKSQGQAQGQSQGQTPAQSPARTSNTKSTVSFPLMQDISNNYPHPALVYIVGGYKQSKNKKDFIPLNDLWKLELFVKYQSQGSDYINFNDSSLGYPIGDFDLDQRNYDDFPSTKHSVKSDPSSSDEEDELHLGTRSRRSSAAADVYKYPEFSGIIKNDHMAWPDPRGFFALELFDNKMLYSEHTVESNVCSPVSPAPKKLLSSELEPPSTRQSSPLGSTVTDSSGNRTFSSPPLRLARSTVQRRSLNRGTASPGSSNTISYAALPVNKTLMVHGGSTYQYKVVTSSKRNRPQKYSKKKILSDLWWFNLAEERWEEKPTFVRDRDLLVNSFALQELLVKRCGHTLLKSDNRYMILIGGALEIDMKNDQYYNDYKKDTSSLTKTSSASASTTSEAYDLQDSSSSSVDSDRRLEDLQEIALRSGVGSGPPDSELHSELGRDLGSNLDSNKVTPKERSASPVDKDDGYHRLLILDTKTRYWRTAKYFHTFNVRPKYYTDKPQTTLDPRLDSKIYSSLRRLFFSNICGSLTSFDSRIFIIGGECRPHLPEEIEHLKNTSLINRSTQIMLGSICVFEIPTGH